MPAKRKKFIDKKNAVTFHLVHRSQKDPLQADDEAPQRVLLPADSKQVDESRFEEQKKFGVFFDDDYDYMQHLRDANELNQVEPLETTRTNDGQKQASGSGKSGINLPSTVFASTAETEVGMLNKAAPVSGPRLDWDPDIVAAMDEDFDFDDPENQLDDDFMCVANQEGDEDNTQEIGSDDGELFDDEDDAEVYRPVKPLHPVTFKPDIEVCHSDDDVASDEADFSDADSDYGEGSFENMDSKSKFTDYSMTSSVTARNKGLSLLDDRFEKLYDQYGDEEIGALDHEDITGARQADNLVLTQALHEFETQQKINKMKDAVERGGRMEDCEEEEDNDEDLVQMTIRPAREKWDCESILSTRSTLYNHPTLISEPKKKKGIELTKRAGIPADVLPTRGLTRRQLEEMEQKIGGDRANTFRAKDETTEDRKERKRAIKEERKERREQKKSNKMAFKSEEMRQQKETLNVQQNKTGISLT